MTDPSDPRPHDAADPPESANTAEPPDAGDLADPADAADAAGTPTVRPSLFGLEGRAAPGLYLVGWVAGGIGLGVLAVSILAGGSTAAPWLFLAGLLLFTPGIFAAAGSQAIERGRRPDLAYRGPAPVLLLLVAVPLTLIGVLVVIAPLAALGLDARSPVATALSVAVTLLAYVGVVRLLVVGPGALAWRDMGLSMPATAAARDLVIGAAFAVPVLLVTLLLGGLLSRFLPTAPSVLPAAGDTLGLVANLLAAAVLAPIGEEIFFRGFATTAWAKAVGAGPAIVRGAVFFAAAHVLTLFDESFALGAQRALFSFLALLPVALALGWLYLSRRSLYASIGLHAAFNGIQVVLLFAAASAS